MKKRESSESAVTVRGLIETMYFSKDGFAAGLLRLADDSTVKFAGPIYAHENDPVVLCGRWHDHPKYGRQFKVTGVSLDLEIDAAGLARYLANHPEFKGIGPAKAALIAEEFAGNFNEIITHNPEAIARAAKLSLDKVYAVREAWLENRNRNAAATHLAAYGLTHKQITALVEQFGDSVVPMLEENPYLLVSAVPGMGFKRIDKAARKMNTPKDSPGRIRAGLLYCINEALEDGDCWVEYEDLLDRANLLLVMDDLDSREMIERHLEALIREGELVTSPYECLVVAKPEIEQMERDLADALQRAAGPNPHYSDFAGLEALARTHEPRLNAQQCEAVATALQHRVSLLSGGAGTGKTFTIRALVEICREKGLRVEMAAPTGKAAKRMEQLVEQPAQTIHRLLQFDGHGFKVGPGNPIQAGMVIVDECLDYKQPILTEAGWQYIGTVVNQRLPLRVWSLNADTGQLELKPIVRWLKRDAPKDLVCITAGRTESCRNARSIRCTTDHKILTPYGYRRAGEILPGEEVIVRAPAFTLQQRSILIGSLLGDGCMGRRQSGSPQATIVHGQDQIDYLRFKQAAFGALAGALNKHDSGYGAKPVWRMSLQTTDETHEFAREMIQSGNHRSGRRRWIPTDSFLAWVDELALAVWYLDNGSLNTRTLADGTRSYYVSLHTERFSHADNLRLATFLERRFGVKPRVAPDSRGHWLLRFNKAETEKFLAIIAPFVPACMQHKIPGKGSYEYAPSVQSQTCIARVRAVERCRPASCFVFDIEVAENHNYVAGNIVVSNCSMVDVRLAWRLFQAIDFSRTALLLVGDHNQLPPVGPGNVLRDLIQSRAIPTVVLPKVMRQAGELKENCAAILDGEVRPTSDCEVRGRRPWYVVDQFSDSMEVRRFLLMLFEKVLAERLRFDIVKDVQVLSPTHKGPIGTRSLNIDLQQLIQWKLHGARTPETDENSPPAFLLHDKVIQTRNNYKTGIMNGTIGFVADVLSDGGIVVDFDGALVSIARDSPEWPDLQLAYSLSIHKAQGSEFPCAIVITHKSHEFQHHRSLLYTGVTRAQHSAIILGDHWGIHHCARKRQVDRRNTFLSFLLAEPHPAPP
jgi:ATP-dependent exoDNAse (exonuclease V) alpha subunit